MTVKKHHQAPTFSCQDIYGQSVSLPHSSGNTKVLLHFMRYAGCPVCNFRVHELKNYATRLQKAGIAVYLIYESEAEHIREYAQQDIFPFTFLADPQARLFKLFRVENSWWKLMFSYLKGVYPKSQRGKKLFKTKVGGHYSSPSRIPAEFLIDEYGSLLEVHYGRFLGDDVKLDHYLEK